MKLSRRKVLEAGVASAALAGCAYPRRGPLPPDAKLRGRIEHLVVLMMENRSYDQMLGALPGAQYDGAREGTLLSYRDLGIHRVVLGAAREGWQDGATALPFIDRYASWVTELA